MRRGCTAEDSPEMTGALRVDVGHDEAAVGATAIAAVRRVVPLHPAASPVARIEERCDRAVMGGSP
jgi:hypothetical protein